MFVTFKGGFMGTVKDEEWADVALEETTETVVEGSDGGVGAFLAGLDLEGPYGDVDCYD
jgi:hypothetical protein